MPANRASLREAVGVRSASELGRADAARSLPVSRELETLLPQGIRTGSTLPITATASSGATSLMLALLAGPSRAGQWCAVVGQPRLLPEAADESGVTLNRLALIPEPRQLWDEVVAALIEGIGVIAFRLAAAAPHRVAVRLAAKARRSRAVLVPFGPGAPAWPDTGLGLTVEAAHWRGLGTGSGRVTCCELDVRATAGHSTRRARVCPVCFCGDPASHAAPAPPVASLDDYRARVAG
ncbi:MAG TPA: hypothetical protein VE172_06500 [Stackebrandtia sp.]|uniref:hypothetical protein n=1 Tax=Stackebrandtia sp. TaxID=2023065 RepID=UPI002D68157C|nr:hypothetical protein [Stackebrandtia sp.]HZE38447.1 hypothetical protein [Stackebrandtia sp.]